MVLNCPLADTKVRGDILARVSGEHQLHDLVLTRCEARDMPRRILSPRG